MEEKPPSPDQLTEREIEILEHLATGLSDQQIAAALFLSSNTVRWYNRQIYNKLGVGNRTQAIAQARVLGLLDSKATPTSPPVQTSHQVPTTKQQKVEQRIHFTHSYDGTRIAYAIAGNGPPLVKAANYMSHQEYDWDSPVWQHWLEELTHEHSLITSDERGSGLSDWDTEDVSFEAWVRDLEAVVDAAGVRQFPVFGMSQGGAVAVAYTALHPEKVSHLIVHGGYARGWLNRDLTPEGIEEEKLMISLMRVGWGRDNPAFRQVFAMQLFPQAPAEQIHALEMQMRISVSPENAVRLESEMHRIDVRHLATQIKVPALILHSRGDEAVPFNEGRLLASLIPNAQFVALESKNHLLTEHEPAWQKFVTAFRNFLSSSGV
ncbi:MAG: alpha/beta fold hydrolase [Anaerolineae bacterium]|nr:alpha/beta fold hydrolase [Anaerolineae bacterium]NUQ04425.1 alpha/beta fold hydrolase [Anaerolineae bacterium]